MIERALRLSCVLGVAALAAACGGGEPEDDSADDATTMSVQGTLAAGTRTTAPATNARTSGIILSEKTTLRPLPGIVLSEKPTGGIVLSEFRAKTTDSSQKADESAADDDEATGE